MTQMELPFKPNPNCLCKGSGWISLATYFTNMITNETKQSHKWVICGWCKES